LSIQKQATKTIISPALCSPAVIDEFSLFFGECVIAGNLAIGEVRWNVGQRVALFWG
jgi:hypothetical protein